MEPPLTNASSLYGVIQEKLRFFPLNNGVHAFYAEIAKLIQSGHSYHTTFHKKNTKYRKASLLVVPTFSGWLSTSPTAKTYCLMLILPEKALYQTHHKKIKRCLVFEGAINDDLTISHTHYAFYKKYISPDLKDANSALEKIPSLGLPSTSKILFKMDFKRVIKAYEYHQLTWVEPQYEKDLEEQSDLPLINRLLILSDFLKALIALNMNGWCHGDVKTKNVFIALGDNGRKEGLLSDFDHALPLFNLSQMTEPYCMWDTLREQIGLATPFTDIYGFVMTLAVTIDRKFFSPYIYSDSKEALRHYCQKPTYPNNDLYQKCTELLQRVVKIDVQFEEALNDPIKSALFRNNEREIRKKAYEALIQDSITLRDIERLLDSLIKLPIS